MTDSNDAEHFAGGRGLVGGRGELRAGNSKLPPLDHWAILEPYRHPDHLDAGRAFYAADHPIEVEIGFGRSHFLRERVQQVPDVRYLGFEVRRPWVERVARFCDREAVTNARVVLADARPLLARLLPPAAVSAFYVFFPDPWWKKRHHKRRVVSAETLDLMYGLLAPGGRVHVRTDVAAYAERVDGLLAADPRWTPTEPGVDARGRTLPLTHREKKCAEHGLPVYRHAVSKP